MLLTNTIIYLIGHGGTGKYTIAKEIVKKTGAKLVDNHLINNPVFSVIEQDGILPINPAIWEEALKIRNVVVKTIKTISPPDYSFVFTNDLQEHEPIDHTLYRQIERLAKFRRASLFPVRLLCDAASLRLRKSSIGRRERLKEIDVSRVEWLLKNREILKIKHPNLLTLDVSDITAEQSAEKILEHVRIRHAD